MNNSDQILAKIEALARRVDAIERHRLKRESHRQQLILALLMLMSITVASTKLSANNANGKASWTFELAGGAGITAVMGAGGYALFQLNKTRKDDFVGGENEDSNA